MIWVFHITGHEDIPIIRVFPLLPSFTEFKEKLGPKFPLPEGFEVEYFKPWIIALKQAMLREPKPWTPDFIPHCAFNPGVYGIFKMEGHQL